MALPARMKFFMRLAEAFDADVGVDLGGADVGMAEHFLDGPEVSAMIEEVGGEGVPEHVRGHVLLDIGGAGVVLDDAPDRAAAHAAPAFR